MKKFGFEHQDLEQVILHSKKLNKRQDIKNQKRNNLINNTGVEKKKHVDTKLHKIENETENMKVEKINKSISQEIRNNRTKMNLKQKDLANRINMPVQIIQQYENGSSQTDIKILLKLEKVLRCKLTGKGFTK